MEKLYKTDEAAEYLRISRWTVIRRANDGELRYFNNGSPRKPRFVFPEQSLKDYLAARSS